MLQKGENKIEIVPEKDRLVPHHTSVDLDHLFYEMETVARSRHRFRISPSKTLLEEVCPVLREDMGSCGEDVELDSRASGPEKIRDDLPAVCHELHVFALFVLDLAAVFFGVREKIRIHLRDEPDIHEKRDVLIRHPSHEVVDSDPFALEAFPIAVELRVYNPPPKIAHAALEHEFALGEMLPAKEAFQKKARVLIVFFEPFIFLSKAVECLIESLIQGHEIPGPVACIQMGLNDCPPRSGDLPDLIEYLLEFKKKDPVADVGGYDVVFDIGNQGVDEGEMALILFGDELVMKAVSDPISILFEKEAVPRVESRQREDLEKADHILGIV